MINRKRALPLGVLVVGLLVVLAGIGIVSGLWSKNLVINGTVETGDLNVDWVVASSGDEFGPDDCTGGPVGAPPWNPLFPCPAPDKDVGRLDCFIDDKDAQILHFKVYNGYPSYEADCEVEFRNTGSIPFNMVGFAILPGSGLTDCALVTALTQSQIMLCDELKIGFFDNVGLQVDPGDQPGSSIRIHVEQDADQSTCTGTTSIFDPPGTRPPFPVVDPTCTELTSYEFGVKLCVAQWNEAADYLQCTQSPQHEGPTADRIIDADGIASPFSGDPAAREVLPGDTLTSWPTNAGAVGIDMFDNDADGKWTPGDDLHSEDTAACPTAIRDGKHDLGKDCKILDINGDLVDGQGVECDLEFGIINPNGWSSDGVACPPTNNLAFHDANNNGVYDLGEDIVLDVNGNGVFD